MQADSYYTLKEADSLAGHFVIFLLLSESNYCLAAMQSAKALLSLLGQRLCRLDQASPQVADWSQPTRHSPLSCCSLTLPDLVTVLFNSRSLFMMTGTRKACVEAIRKAYIEKSPSSILGLPSVQAQR